MALITNGLGTSLTAWGKEVRYLLLGLFCMCGPAFAGFDSMPGFDDDCSPSSWHNIFREWWDQEKFWAEQSIAIQNWIEQEAKGRKLIEIMEEADERQQALENEKIKLQDEADQKMAELLDPGLAEKLKELQGKAALIAAQGNENLAVIKEKTKRMSDAHFIERVNWANKCSLYAREKIRKVP